jgi:dTDP-glucose 4,6-dehydratase
MKKTILVTGGAGFIGSNFVRYIYNHYPDYRIIVLDALTYAGSVENLPVDNNEHNSERLVFWYGNVRNGELVDTLVSQSDVVVHFAAETHVTRSIYDNFIFFETDVLGTQTVANAALKYKDSVERFIHISTSEVYGTAEKEKMDEEHPLMPMSPYAAAKAGADRLVYSYWATYELPFIIIRPFNNYGPYQHLEKAVPRFIKGEVFNVASSVHRSILSVAQDIVKMMGKEESVIRFSGDRPGQVFRHTGDIAKIENRLGWQPHVCWEEGLERTIAWYKDNRPWWGKQLWMRAVPITTRSGKKELH